MQSDTVSEEIIKRLRACESLIETGAVQGLSTDAHVLQGEFLEILAEHLSEYGALTPYAIYQIFRDFLAEKSLVQGAAREATLESLGEDRYHRMNDFFSLDTVTGRVIVHPSTSYDQQQHPSGDICQKIDTCLNMIAECVDSDTASKDRQAQGPEIVPNETELRQKVEDVALSEEREETLVEKQEEAFEEGVPFTSLAVIQDDSSQQLPTDTSVSTATALVIGTLSAGFLLGLITIFLVLT